MSWVCIYANVGTPAKQGLCLFFSPPPLSPSFSINRYQETFAETLNMYATFLETKGISIGCAS